MSLTMSHVSTIVENHRANAIRTPRKQRGGLTPEAIARGPIAAAAANRARARAYNADLAVVMKALRAEGLTFDAIAQSLNAAGEVTRNGASFDRANVFRILGKYA
jgi:hypothetical protein